MPHFVRFTRALALVSGCAAIAACSSSGMTDRCNSDYDGCVMGSVAYDGGPHGTVAYDGGETGVTDAAYDGGKVGPPTYDGGPTGLPAYDGGEVGSPAYDGGVTGVVALDAGTDASEDASPPDAQSDVFMGGGPLAPPDLPA